VGVLMYSAVDANTALSRDGDPQLFHLFLEESDESLKDVLTLADLIPLDYETPFVHPTLKPYLFNMQTHMLEKTSRYIQDIIIHYDADKGKPLTYERKTTCFEEVAKKEMKLVSKVASCTKCGYLDEDVGKD